MSINYVFNSKIIDEERRHLGETSVDDFLNSNLTTSRAKSFCKNLIFLTCGSTKTKNISLLWWLEILNNAGGFFKRLKFTLTSDTKITIKTGLSEMINCLEKKIISDNEALKIPESVELIKFNDYHVWVTTNKKIYKCSNVIVAVPPSEIKKIKIMGPINPSHLEYFNQYMSQSVGYFETTFKSSLSLFEYSGTIVASYENKLGPRLIYKIKNNIFAGYFSSACLYNSRQSIIQMIRKFLHQNCQVIEHREKIYEQGLMNIFRPCSIDKYIDPMNDKCHRIIFAASEYAKNWPGTADGAVEAGEHAACLTLYYLRPQSLTLTEVFKFMPLKLIKKKINYELWLVNKIFFIVNSLIFWNYLRKAYNF
ncbi:uncharacterized protein LOC122853006 [Aphidius gifuensis]|nr:uncharacterized protein LOC122853006 [Aphidius gifuensis]